MADDDAGDVPLPEMPEAEPNKGNRMTLKDWVTMLVAVLALVVSGTTAYFNILQRSYAISAVVTNPPGVIGFNSHIEVSDSEATIVFINSGNRPIAITDVDIWVTQPNNPKDKDCRLSGYRAISIQTNFEPFAIKEREIVTKRIKATASPIDKYDDVRAVADGLAMPVAKENAGLDKYPVMLCYLVQMATPLAAFHTEYIPLRRYRFPNERDWGAWNMDTPVQLIRQTELAW